MSRLEKNPFINQVEGLGIPKHPPVTQEEIDRANADLRRSSMGLDTTELLRRAERAGQHLEVDSFFPDDSPFRRTQITRDAFGEAIRRKNAKSYNKPVPETFLK